MEASDLLQAKTSEKIVRGACTPHKRDHTFLKRHELLCQHVVAVHKVARAVVGATFPKEERARGSGGGR